jgi:hypothetical protein
LNAFTQQRDLLVPSLNALRKSVTITTIIIVKERLLTSVLSPNIIVELLRIELLLYLPEIPDSNPGPATGHPD